MLDPLPNAKPWYRDPHYLIPGGFVLALLGFLWWVSMAKPRIDPFVISVLDHLVNGSK